MYKVTVVTDGKEYPLLNQVLRLENPTLKEYAGNSPGYLKFKITSKHPYYDKWRSSGDGAQRPKKSLTGHTRLPVNQILHISAIASSDHLSSRAVLWSL